MTRAPQTHSTVLHATCVAVGNVAVLLMGPSGSGKSSTALRLMAMGGRLVSDDRTCLERKDGEVFASAPEALRGRIEARGVGILRADTVQRPVMVGLAVDLGREETMRLPEKRTVELLGCNIPLLYRAPGGHFAESILLYAKGGRSD